MCGARGVPGTVEEGRENGGGKGGGGARPLEEETVIVYVYSLLAWKSTALAGTAVFTPTFYEVRLFRVFFANSLFFYNVKS